MRSKNTNPKPIILSILMALLLFVGGVAGSALAASPGDVVINEIMQNPSAVSDSAGEWLELYNPTASDIDLDGWTIQDNDTDAHTIDNGGPLVIPAGGYLVLGNNSDTATNGGVTVDYAYGSGWYLGNSSDEVVLLDGAMNEIDRVEYDDGATFPDPNGASMMLFDPTLDNNVGANWCQAITPFGDGDLGTPHAVNDCPTGYTSIYDIQFTTDPGGVSPYNGQTVTTQGIVTAFFYDGGNRYTFIQDGSSPWNGLLLYKPNGFVNVGDMVEVTGEVSEYYGLTEIAFGTVNTLSSGHPLPDPISLPTGSIPQEQWESVLVRAELAEVADADLGYGEWLVDNCSGGVRVDDMGSYSYAPAEGDLLNYVQGPLFYSYGDYKIEPRDDSDISLGTALTPIYTIQGSGPASPLDGMTVTTEGVVTGDFQLSNQMRGFFLQDETGDGDPTTSDGLFVYAPDYYGFDVSAGESIRLQAEVDEYYELTELTYVSALQICGTSSVAPTEVILPVPSVDYWEQYEGMLVMIPQTLYASDNYNLGRYGELLLSVNDRLYIPTNVVEPGAPAQALQNLNNRSSIQLDDASNVENPLPLPPYLGEENTLRAGDTIPNLTGVLGYAYSAYEIHPTDPVTFTRVNTRPTAPPTVGGSMKVASFNVLNYFTTIDTGDPICGPTGGMECRGADTVDEFADQRVKIIQAILEMDTDVVGLMEMENHPTDAALQDLVNGLNDIAGSGTYALINTGPIGTDAIKVAFIYKPATVSPVGPYAILDSSWNPDFIDTKNRPVLAQTFQQNGTEDLVTAAVNHLKSKSSPCDDIGDPDIGDGQGNCNLTRTKAAAVLANWLAIDPTGSGSADFLIIGDLNSYAMEDPIDAIKAAGYTNLIEEYEESGAYSYVYYGQAGYLDHALSNPSLTNRVTGTKIWHINADEPNALNYNDYNQPDLYQPDPFRSSDHDPVVVGLCETTPPVVEISLSTDTLWPVNHKYTEVTAVLEVTDADPDAMVTLVSVTSNQPDDDIGDGKTADDIDIVDDYTFKLRAERSGVDEDRIYTITYEVTDACGNTTLATATVTVPHDKGGK